jgi:hypothetical protein
MEKAYFVSAPSDKAKSTQTWYEDNMFICFTKQLACIITRSQSIGLFCLRIHFGQTWLQKTLDFDQIQNPLDQDSGRNATTTRECCGRKEMSSCCDGTR